MGYHIYRICRICNCSMNQHPELRGWLKCSCGFCKPEKPMITLEMYLMGRDKKYPKEFNQEIVDNAKILLERINALLQELKVEKVIVSSGWRPPSLNATIGNAAKKSLHQTGKACDLKDNENQDLCKLIEKHPELLIKFNLWMESPENTKGWMHLDMGLRTDRPIRIFKA